VWKEKKRREIGSYRREETQVQIQMIGRIDRWTVNEEKISE
jgi:hypothetical protein